MFSIDHLGIAVKSLAAAKGIYEKLGLSVSSEETVEQEKVRLVMVPVGESRLELLAPTSEDSTIAKFIAKRGEGLHHVCMRVPDLAAAVAKLKGEAGRRDEVFRKQFETEKSHGRVLEKKFDELLRQAKESPDVTPPKRDIDL